MDVDDEFNLDDDLILGDEEYLRLLEKEENQYRHSQIPQTDHPMTIEEHQTQLNIITDIEEQKGTSLVMASNPVYGSQGVQKIEDDFNFDLQRQGYRTEANIIVRGDIINEMENLKRDNGIKDSKIDHLELEVAKLKSRLKREDTPMYDSSSIASVESKVFPNTDSFSVKRLSSEAISSSGRTIRPIKRTMTSRFMTPAPVMQTSRQMNSQRMDTQTSSVPLTPTAPVIDYRKIERQNKLLAVLLGKSFLKWRRNTHIQLGTNLTKNQIHELCRIEAKNLSPNNHCSQDSRERLQLIAADYIEYMLNYESDDLLPKLLNSLRLSLMFALKENQPAIVVYILSKIEALTAIFVEVIHILYKEFTLMDTTSTLFFITMSLKLFYADINPEVPTNLAFHLPNLSQLSLEELKQVTDDYSTKPDVISKIVKERLNPEVAKKGALSILQIMLTISKRVKQSFFPSLLNNESFTALLSSKMPKDIISVTLSVIETYPEEMVLTVFKDVKEIVLFKKMTDLIQSSPPDMSFNEMFQLRERITHILAKLAKMKLSLEALNHLYKQIIPILIEHIKMSLTSTHLYSLSADKREKSILSSVSLIALLNQYSSYDQDEKYSLNTLENFIIDLIKSLDGDHDRMIIQEIKEQLERINNQLNENKLKSSTEIL